MTDIRRPSYQAGERSRHARERFDFVFGKDPKMASGKGKYYLLNFVGMKEAYDAALTDCPIAADAILVLVWQMTLDFNALEFMAKDYEDRVEPTPETDVN